MSEDEAKTKLCPTDAPTGLCLGSGCMAWREIVEERHVLSNGAEAQPGQAYLRSSVVKVNRHIVGGYCTILGGGHA